MSILNKMSILGMIGVFFIVGGINWQEANAASPENAPEKSYVMQPIEVTAQRVLQNIMDVPVSISVITADDIARDPKTSAADFLESVPGVVVEDSFVPGARSIRIRGFDPTLSVVFIDGVKQQWPDGARFASGLLTVAPEDIERIEVLKGPASVLYGSDAIAGIINIITKKGGDKPLSFRTGFTFDSASESLTPHATAFGRFENDVYYRVSASGTNGKDRRLIDNNRLEGSTFKNRDVNAKLGYDAEKIEGEVIPPKTSSVSE